MVKSIVIYSITGLMFLVGFSKKNEKLRQTRSFRFHLYAFAGASGLHEHYLVTPDSLIVSYDNDNAGAEMHPVYAIKLEEAKSNLFFDFLKTARPDTLKLLYERRKYYSDGLWTQLEIEADFISLKKVRIDEPENVKFLSLVQGEINKLIKKKRYRMKLYNPNIR